jgi:hypothetical protein
MRYYEWLGEIDAGAIRFPDRQFNGFWMVEGRPVIGWNEYMIAVYLCSEVPVFDYGRSCDSWPVFSPRMRKVMEEYAPGLIQFLPFRFQRPDGSGQVTGYCVGQILRLIDCFDRTRTKVRKNWDPINAFGDFDTYWPSDVVLSSTPIGEERLFRVRGNSDSIVIREDLKTAIQRTGFEGQRFDPLEIS